MLELKDSATSNLVLTLYDFGDRVLIGDDIIVRLCYKSGRHVRLSIMAPKDMSIKRDHVNREKYGAKKKNRRPAAELPS